MGRHWESVVRPLLIAVMARILVEVGTAFGGTTTRHFEANVPGRTASEPAGGTPAH
jgi:hypothetical protein